MPGVIPGMTKPERKPMNAWDHPLIKKGMEAQLAKRRARIAAGERPLGWKVGLGAPASMERLGITGPAVGYLMQRALVLSGGTVSFAGWTKPVAEAEICVRMATDLRGGATADTALAAIKEILPAIELADFDPPPTPDNLDVVLEGVVDRAGVHGVDADAARRQLLGEAAHQPDLGVLGGDVGVDAGVAARAGDARGDDDAAAVAHPRHRVLAHQEGALDVYRLDGVEHVLRVGGDRRHGAEVAGVAEEHVDRPEAGDRRLDAGALPSRENNTPKIDPACLPKLRPMSLRD